MRLLFSSLVFFLVSLLTAAQDSVATFTIETQLAEQIEISGAADIFLTEDQFSPQQIFQNQDEYFHKGNELPDHGFPLTVWSRLRLANISGEPLAVYLSFCGKADAVTAFAAADGLLAQRAHTGKHIHPLDKPAFSIANHLPVNLAAGEARTYFFQAVFTEPMPDSHLAEMIVRPATGLMSVLLTRYTFQALYTGVMLMFFLLSVFTFYLFRQRVFLYFAGLQLSFVFYFLALAGIAPIFLHPYGNDWHIIDFTIGSIVAFVFLFVDKYVRLRPHFPKFFALYAAVSLFAIFMRPILEILGFQRLFVVNMQNATLLVWMLFTITPVAVLARRGRRVAQNLLAALAVLFITSMLFVMDLLQIIPSNFWTRNGFQFGTIFFSFLLFYGLFEKIRGIRSERQKAETLGMLKSRFFANISHEFRTPLTLLLGPIEQVKNRTENPKDQKLLALAESNAQRLLKLVNQLLDINKLESGKAELRASEENFAELLKGITMSFESYAEQKNVHLHFVSQKAEIPLWVERAKVEAIFYNLLNNAFKFAEAGGEVAVMIVERAATVEVMVKDDGAGIAKDELPQIFDRFFQGDNAASPLASSGIGLALVRELVLLHKAEISVESEKGQGTVFTLKFKNGDGHLSEKDKVEKTTLSKYPASFYKKKNAPIINGVENGEAADLLSQKKSLKSAPTVLIIDDNADVRAYIRYQLENSFQIREANDGEAGIETALENPPELIISDVMMPKKNGFEVCDFLKKDERTSHVPIILLTARAAQNEKVKGLEYGADDYLTKPFDSAELEVRIRKLIELRARLRQKIQADPTFSFKELTGSPVDVQLIEKVNGIICQHLEDSQFGVGELADEIGLSRAHLNRKLKALTDLPANKHILHQRLKKGLALLETAQHNVSEVAAQMGFNSTAYFVKCFREFYGKTPGSVGVG